MPYYGQLEIEVRLMREGHGIEGKEMAPVAKRVVRMELREALQIRSMVEEGRRGQRRRVFDQVSPVADAIKDVLDEDESAELRMQWDEAIRSASPEQKRRALEALRS
jgi:hypothetical protein